MNKTKKALSVILALCMLLGMVPMGMFSASALKIFGLPVDNLKATITCGINGYNNHNGFDLGVSLNTPLYSMFSGKAVYYQRYDTSNGKSASYGNYVVVTSTDGKYKAYYCHLNSFYGFNLDSSVISCQNYPSSYDEVPCREITIGSKDVNTGDLLGYSGSTGNSTGPHCHIGIKVNNVWKDPADYISFSFSAHLGVVQSDKPYSTSYENAVKSLSLAPYISNNSRRQYAEARIKQWLLSSIGNYRVFRQLSQPSSSGNDRCIVFFFEGCSDGIYSETLSNRMAAACVVVKMQNDVPAVVYYNGNSTTLPDFPREYTSDKNGTATIKDGIYTIRTTNHKSAYAALNVAVSKVQNAAVRGNSSQCFEANNADGINIHAKSFYPISNAIDDRNSAGCFNVGSLGTKYNQTKRKQDKSYDEYNSFIEAVTGQKDAKSSTYTVGLDMGVVIVDRSQYKDKLKTIYNDDDAVNLITAYTDKLPAIGSDSDIPVPEIIINPAPDVSVENAVAGGCTYNVGQAINVDWDQIENARSYTINAKALDGDPMFLFDSTDSETGTAISLTKISNTSYQIPASYATPGKSIKIAVAANYEDGTSKWSARYIRIVPNVPVITSFADEATVAAGQDLTVTWSGATGAQEYEYKVIELEEKTPDRTSESEPARRTIIPLSRTSSESFTISGEDLPSGRAFKIWLSSVGKDNTSKGQSYYFFTDGVETNIPVTGIAFESETLALTVGSTAIKRPVFTPKTATNKGLTYVSENPAVASVDADGIVTAVAAGTTRITATAADGGYSASFTVSVITQQQSGDRWYHAYSPYYDKRITPELIQQFLESYGGSLKNTTTVDGETRVQAGATTFSLGFENYFELNIAGSDTKNGAGLSYAPLNTYASAKSMTPAEIIYHACMKNNFNVVFVLAKLQQEMSLITLDLTQSSGTTTPETRIRKAMGYLYATSDNGHNWGFYGQVLGATYNISTKYWDDGIRTMENAYNTYTPPKVTGNMLYSTFLTNIYNPYAAKFDALLSGATVTSENVLLDDQSFRMEYPAQEESVISLSPLNVSWTSCEGADYYMISMRDVTEGEEEGKSNLLFSRQRVDDLEYTIAGSYFTKDHRYKIAVGAYYTTQSGKGYEKWITPYTYVTVSDSASLGRPAFVSPVNNTQIAENTPITVHWAAASGANSYNINVRDLTTDTKIIDARDVGDATSYTIPVSENGSNILVSGHRYRVAVEAKNYSGDSRWADPHLQFSVAGDVPQQDLAEHLTEVPAGFTGINSASDLQNVRNNLSGKYILMNDVDLSGNGNWDPVGTESTAFNGTFNGNGYAIKNASAASSSLDSVGLFGCNEGTIVNLTLGISASGNWCVGGIAGINKGTIQNCTVNGAVRNYSSSFDQTNGHSGSYVGGICGTNTGTITSCISSASTVASGSDVPNGCLAGQNYAGGTIQTSYASGNVNGGIAGGLVGLNNAAHLEQDASIENCYALGNVNGNIAGGLVGRCRNHSTEYSGKGVIRNSYASNYVVGSNQNYVGGIVGDVACNYEVSGCYYNSEISTCTDTNKGSPRNNTQMQSASTFTGWAMGSVWNVAANVNNGYPYLRGIEATNRNLNGDKASDFTYKLTDNNKTVQITGYQGTRVDVTIPAIIEGKPVTSISGWAFQNRSDLLCINLPDTMLTVSEYAFSGCTKLNDISFGNSVRSIGYGAFYGCTELKDVSLPASIVSSPGCPFVNCGVKTATLKYGMTVVPSRLFDGCESLETVNIPSSVIAINEYAFCNCKSLKEVTLPKGLQKILCCGFAGCTNLESIRIPSGTTILSSQGYGAFRESGLKTVAFDTGTTKIPSYAFESCEQLKTVIIPSGVTTIESYAFRSCSAISKVELPNTVVSIGYAAFNGCNSLEEIGFGNSLQTIDAWAFAGCSKLEYVYIPKGITRLQSGGVGAFRDSGLVTIEFESGTTAIPDYCVQYCEHLTDVIIPTGVKTIGNYAFQSCTALQSVELPDTINAIGYSSFNGCSSLSDIDLGNGLQTIDAWAFAGCSKLEYVYIPKGITRLQSGGVGAFRDSGLVTIEFESGTTAIPDYCVQYCEHLTDVIIPTGVKTIGNYAFQSCTALQSVELPDTINAIGYSSFNGCSSLSDIDLGNGLQTIDAWAFAGCSKLKYVFIPKSITRLQSGGVGAFRDSGLVTVELEPGIDKIPEYSFERCENLATIDIPSSVKTVGNYAFYWCVSLTDIKLHTGLETIGYRSFSQCGMSSIILPDSLITIDSCAFQSCTELKDVDFGNTVQEIRGLAFSGCNSLESVYIPSSVKATSSGGSGAFERSGVVTVEFENGVQEITAYSFAYCENLEKVIIPRSVTDKKIGYRAFEGHTDKLTIYGYRGSYAQTYAEENSISFQEITSATGVILTPSSVTLYPSDTRQLTATVQPENATNPTVTWKSMNTAVASVSGTGLVTAVAPGTAKIMVTAWDGGWTAYSDITVLEPSLSFQTSTVSLQIGESFALEVSTAPENQIVTWNSSDSNVARIRNGVITARSNGSATITATMEYGGKTYTATCIVTVGNVAPTLTGIKVKTLPIKTVYTEGDPFDQTGLTLTATYSDGNTQTVSSGFTCRGYQANKTGEQTIEVTYNGLKTSFTVMVNPKAMITLDTIAVTKRPTKTTYYVGETLDTAGMEVTATYSDNSTKTVTGWICNPTKLNTEGTQTITVSYTEDGVTKTATFNVTVKPVPVLLDRIAVTTQPTKKTYYVGDTIDTAGMVVTATYSDGSSKPVTNYTCAPTKLNTKGTQTITVSYTEGGVTKTATFSVTVNEKEPDPDVTLSSIAVTKNPTKAIYDIGEPLDTAGIVITATYSDGSTKKISASGCTFTGFDSGSAGVKTVTVTYQRKTDTFDVTVREFVPTSNGQIYVDPAKGYIGQRFDVTIRLQSNPGLVAARLEIGYDASILKLVDAKNGEVITGGSFTTSQTFEKNPYVAMWSDSTTKVDYTADGVLLTLTFEVLETAEVGTTEITVTYDPSATFNQAMEDKALTIHNGTVEITERVVGDADGDGVLNLKDVVVLRRMLAGWEGYSINDTNADVDGDGKVTLKDAVLLERYLAGWDVTLK